MTITTVNPAKDEVIARYELQTDEEIDTLLDDARRAYRAWRDLPFAERGEYVSSLAKSLRDRSDPLARLIATEMGKPLSQGGAEVEKCAWVCEHYAEHAEALLSPQRVATEAKLSEVVFQPLGTVFAIMPWNFPLWQFFRFAAPALMAGNAAVLRHASNVTGTALEIEKLCVESGLPKDVVRSARVSKEQIAQIIADPRIAAVTLTGGVTAGQAVGSAAGGAIKKSVLELGGSDPYLVLRDADLELAVERCVSSRLINAGQSCIAAKRFIVEQPLLHDFVAAFVEAMRAKRMADPFEAEVDLGPLAVASGREALHDQVRRSVAAGTKCALGGEIPDMPGFFYPPTVLTGVEPGMAAFDEELFGPVAAIIEAKDEEHAIELANRSVYGLGAAVFTRDIERGHHIAATRLEAGVCCVNDLVQSDPRLPFGGVKESGYGRELGAIGIQEFVNVKTVWVGDGEGARRGSAAAD